MPTNEVTPTQQQIDFIVRLRKHMDAYGNESLILNAMAIELKMPRESVVKIIRDINSSLHGVKIWEIRATEICGECNRPVNNPCDRCAIRDRIQNNNDALI